MERRWTDRFVVILAAGLVLRLALFVFFLGSQGWQAEVWEDGRIAANILDGKGYTLKVLETEYKSFHAPVYPLVLAGMGKLAGPSLFPHCLFQLFVSLGMIGGIYGICRRWLGERTAILAGWVVAIEPGLLVYGSYKMVPVALASFWIVLWLHLFMEADEKRDWKLAVGAGIVLGMGMLTRPDLGVLALPVGMWWVIARRSWRWGGGVAFPIMIAASVVLSPWLFRNYRLHRRLLLTTDFAAALWAGNNPASSGTLWDRKGDSVLFQAKKAWVGTPGPRTELGNFDWFVKEAVRWIRENPVDAGKGFIRKLYYSWWFSPEYATRYYKWVPRPVLWLYKALYGAVLFAALAGTVTGLRDPKEPVRRIVFIAVVVAATFSLVHSVFHAEGRHRVVVMPLLAILASHGVMGLRKKRWPAT